MAVARGDGIRRSVAIENAFALFVRVVGMPEAGKISWFHVEEI